MQRSTHLAAAAVAFASLVVAGCGGGSPPADGLARASAASTNAGDGGGVALRVLSGPAQWVSGGDARIEVSAAPGLHKQLEFWLNGRRITPSLVADGHRLEGVVDGLADGDNLLEVRHRQGQGQGVTASLRLTNHPITGPLWSGPQQKPFVCTATQFGLQPLVDMARAPTLQDPGYEVTDASGNVIGHSRHCSIDTFVSYWYRAKTGGGLKPMPADGSKPADLGQTTLADGRVVDFIVRREVGSINRFLYSFAMLAPHGEDRAQPDLGRWNRRLLYWFQGGVAIGHSQGRVHGGSMNADILADGTAIVHSSGNNTGTHYNLQVAGETALMTKERFIERYGVPRYTVGLGGSGGAIQQYVIQQNVAGVLDAALPVQSYPDMVTQTIHIGDCELLEHYMDATDRANPKWRVTKNRSWLVGLNAEETPAGQPDVAKVNDPFHDAKLALGYSSARGSTECRKSWLGLSALSMNPWYGQADNQQKMAPAGVMATVQWTHYDDLRNIYGVDGNGNPRPTWDNVGVQYGLQSLRAGLITPDEFVDVNYRVGGWKHPSQMVQEGFPYLGPFSPQNFDLWSRRNMNLAPDAASPAPRTAGDPIAMRAAYTSGMVFGGRLVLPTIDHRQYLERELDMHNVHQSFAVRQRMRQAMGHSDHLVIWFTDTVPGQPKASQTFDAIAVMDEWMANIRANPGRSLAENRPPRAVDSCFDARGQLIHAGADAWDGILDAKPAGPCTQAFPLFKTSRIVAGAPIEGGIYRCALKSIDQAIADGTYGAWTPTGAARAKLEQVFPDGVCDYGRPDQARP